MTKCCTKCHQNKPLEAFYIDKKTIDGYCNRCKECKRKHYHEHRIEILKRMRRYQQSNKQHLQNYYQKNKERICAYSKQWRKDHPEAFRIAHKKWRTKFNQTPLGKLRHATRRRIENQMKRLKIHIKTCSYSDNGCSSIQLKQHIESKFQPGMTWDNYGWAGWHLDHIRPIASFDLTKPEEILAANHYTNLQPLWAKDNIVKGDKYEEPTPTPVT